MLERYEKIHLVMGDTAVTPNDGGTYGSGTTPNTVPAVRAGAAKARELMVAMAATEWGIKPEGAEVKDGVIKDKASGKTMTYAQAAKLAPAEAAFKATYDTRTVALTEPTAWQVMGKKAVRPNLRDVVTGKHQYPSDIVRPGMLYGKVMRPPSFGATLKEVDLAPAQAMKGVVAVRDGNFVGCAAPNSMLAQQAVDAIAATAKWDEVKQPNSKEIYEYLKSKAQANPTPASVETAINGAAKKLSATYHIPYVAHVPMEPRAAVAEWEGEKLTVWTGTQDPAGRVGELAGALRDTVPANIRVIAPDFGGGFGGKTAADQAIEAARLAKAAGKPVHLRWTREEEFTWAYFRPAAVLEMRAGIDAKGVLTGWEHINTNSGPSSLPTPYGVEVKNEQFRPSQSPLRQGSYRALAATANSFARESFMDELAYLAEMDPLAFRLANLKEARMLGVLNAAAKGFGWEGRKKASGGAGYGIACSNDKGSVVACCAEVTADAASGAVKIKRLTVAYECGAIVNPHNLRQQVTGGIVQGLGPALREAIEFENGKITNATLSDYKVPRFSDVPPIEVILLNRPDLPSAGAGETPIIALAPALNNAIFDATKQRLRELPLRLGATA